MKRLTWLVGPPGSGKSTWANGLRAQCRVVEFTEMLGPLVNSARIRKGVLRANGALVRLVRELELHPENLGLPPVLVVAGLVPEDALFPLGEHEEALLLLPPRERWEEQLRRRPTGGGSSGQYDDYEYAEQWYGRFSAWQARGFPCTRLELPHQPGLLGKIADAKAGEG
ncbi:ATP-binding protein [Polyangium aurulentum]|uniref:ATP-binding protein n=1 Tax=Polyangium aurulentum TaxID=2567896 RepID=UPI0010AE66FE|nr:ATP-binding protein [Polyangium aurulentum]UQA58609.1 ATP-binding protein [Polyangium aurulentum]